MVFLVKPGDKCGARSKGWWLVYLEREFYGLILLPAIKISINMDISIIKFYMYIKNINRYFYKNIDSIITF